MRNNILAVLTAALCVGLFASVPAHGSENCGGQYPFAVEVQQVDVPEGPVMGVSYCSDGTLQELGVPPSGDGVSGCGGGEHPATVEAEPGLPQEAPISGYCSDGTLDALSDPEGAVETIIGLIEGELP